MHQTSPPLEDGDENEAGQFGAAQYADGGVVDFRKSTSSKTRSYFSIIKLLSGLLSGISSIVEPTPEEERRYLADFENAASYDNAGNPGFVKYKNYHVIFKRGLSGTTRLKHDTIMRRPHIAALWESAESAERLYLADLQQDTPHDQEMLPCGDYAASFWPAYRAEFLGTELQPWHVAHHGRFGSSQMRQGDTETVQAYYQSKFIIKSDKERAAQSWPQDCKEWDSMFIVIQAHLFFSNLNENIKAKIMQGYPALVDPAHFHG